MVTMQKVVENWETYQAIAVLISFCPLQKDFILALETIFQSHISFTLKMQVTYTDLNFR